ncbi:substrate-binding domain-containing protein [Eubacterium aggregans]|uniref:substrate-binding domain-containing protein n=1 Tax=Eubacterium aggregans TaxID=81409 RepID=UPI003F328D6C
MEKLQKKAFADFNIAKAVNIVAATTTAPQLATVIAAGEADAAIVWKENCKIDGVAICDTPDMLSYTKVVSSGRLNFKEDSPAADAFSEFLVSDTAHWIWNAFGYDVVQ